MPNIRQIAKHHENIDRIDKALKDSQNFTDRRVYFDPAGDGQQRLMDASELERMRSEEERGLQDAGRA